MAAFIVQLAVDVSLHGVDTSLFVLLNFQLSKPLLLVDQLILHLVVLLRLHINLLSPRLQLLLHSLGLLGLFTL